MFIFTKYTVGVFSYNVLDFMDSSCI